MNVSRKCFLVLLTFIETDRLEFSPRWQGNPTSNISLVKAGYLSVTFLKGNLLAYKHGLRKLQIPFSVHPVALVKLNEVKSKKTKGDRAFFAAAPTLWNTLPNELRALDILNVYCTAKNLLF